MMILMFYPRSAQTFVLERALLQIEVNPDTMVLAGKNAYCFQFTALCPTPGQVREVLLCQEFAGNDRNDGGCKRRMQ